MPLLWGHTTGNASWSAMRHRIVAHGMESDISTPIWFDDHDSVRDSLTATQLLSQTTYKTSNLNFSLT